MSGIQPPPPWTPFFPSGVLGAATDVLTSNGPTEPPSWQPSAGGGGVVGAALNYSPAAGAVDPGTGIAGFVAAAQGGTSRIFVTLAGNTVFAGLPTGADGQQLFVTVRAGNFTLTQTYNGTTAGSKVFGNAAAGSFIVGLGDTMQFFYTAGSINEWIFVA